MSWQILVGDVLDQLRLLPAESAHCCVTSPPYWGLRDYGTAAWEGGDPKCDHVEGMVRGDTERKTPGGRGGSFRGGARQFSSECGKCGAFRIDQQIGLEATPELFIAKMVEVFRGVWRVLRPDGTCWINIGDSYTSGGRATWRSGASENKGQDVQNDMERPDTPPGLKPKDIVGIPWMLAFALRADGWYLRQDIIWAKPNPMPESVTDRCTKAHEYIFLLSKSERYFYDAEAIKERSEGATPEGRNSRMNVDRDPKHTMMRPSVKRGHFNGKTNEMPGREAFRAVTEWRNKRDVWEIASEAFPDAHFATFPTALVRPCILAGSPEGGLVLDPFSGAGTTGLVATRMGRQYVGIELNPEYAEMSRRRIESDAPLFNTMPADEAEIIEQMQLIAEAE